jgi:hypothetical protein
MSIPKCGKIILLSCPERAGYFVRDFLEKEASAGISPG